jgi:ferredoxin/flavodoxin
MHDDDRKKSVKIVYFTGTGGTQRVARGFQRAFMEAGFNASLQRISAGPFKGEISHDLLILTYAVHAFNAPEAVYKWIDCTARVHGVPAAVISVSGGGEMTPNTACRSRCIKKLEKKGYAVIYENMLIMPSNFAVPVKKPLALMLLEALPGKINRITCDIVNGVTKRTKPLLMDRVLSYMGRAEKTGARYFGRRIRVSGTCSGCGWCERNCPAGNITLNSNVPQFGNKCCLCLGCIYGCPDKALEPGIGRFVIIKEGYSLADLEKELPSLEKADVEKLAAGYMWSGLRKYLAEKD